MAVFRVVVLVELDVFASVNRRPVAMSVPMFPIARAIRIPTRIFRFIVNLLFVSKRGCFS